MKELTKGIITTLRSPKTGLKLPVIRQFIKFSLVGVVNTLASGLVYESARRFLLLPPLSANAIAFCAGVTVSYILNFTWTFRHNQRSHRDLYLRFLIVNIVGLGISESVIYLVHSILHVHDRIAFLSAVVVVVFWNFNANRAWTFRVNDEVVKS